MAKLIDKNTIELTDIEGIKEIITSKYIVIAVGTRPKLPNYN